jgi:isopentenyl diphosphate isomerase/L-lactate dehydrogenase-like FMN-dependent dehydrogenase
MDVLGEVRDAIGGAAEVYLDGGVRRGSDVLKALGLGARAVLIGRPYLWGLATGGEEGVRDVVELMRAELSLAMALAGLRRLADIDRSVVAPAPH